MPVKQEPKHPTVADSTSSSTACSSSCVPLSSPYPYYTDTTRRTSPTPFTRSPPRASVCALLSRADVARTSFASWARPPPSMNVAHLARGSRRHPTHSHVVRACACRMNIVGVSCTVCALSYRTDAALISHTSLVCPASPSSIPHLLRLSRTSFVCPAPLPSIPDLARVPPTRSSSPSHCPCVPGLAHTSCAWSSASRTSSALRAYTSPSSHVPHASQAPAHRVCMRLSCRHNPHSTRLACISSPCARAHRLVCGTPLVYCAFSTV
ncbi:hypothetical protein OBBRIDRAFT_7369 [Obba rivulosa]|uniref:Uncharacterized protein n=1 Tax=Obba rivulosa TaxID=1052685 RepID=A0A8E2DV94_9APHY|nr:hypothetical protein OBBRIDRAFT_7369 [Obba rivulosa]